MLNTRAYPTAHDNMMADDAALQRGTLYVSVIEWPQPSVTYPQTRPPHYVPPELDASPRPTGGGLLLHSPHSLVIGMVVPTKGAPLGRRCRPLLAGIQNWCGMVLDSVGIATHPGDQRPHNVTYCGTYHNPYELNWQGEKVVALALKHARHATLIQGIIHIESNHPYFAAWFPPEAMTQGLGCTGVDKALIREAFWRHLPEWVTSVERFATPLEDQW